MDPARVPQEKPPAELRFGGGWKLIVPFALLPLVIVTAAVGVFLLFGKLADRETSPEEYLQRMRTGSTHKRWQAAYELSGLLASNRVRDRSGLETEMLTFLKGSGTDEAQLRRYLVVGLGQIGSEKSVGTLMATAEKDPDAEVKIFAIWALGRIGSPESAPLILTLSRSDDPGIRKTAAFSLGFVGPRESEIRLQELLEDPETDVRWNAALALAQRGNRSGSQVVLTLLDEERLKSATPNLRDSERGQILLSAVNAAGKLGMKEFIPALERLTENAHEPVVRGAARNAIAVVRQAGK